MSGPVEKASTTHSMKFEIIITTPIGFTILRQVRWVHPLLSTKTEVSLSTRDSEPLATLRFVLHISSLPSRDNERDSHQTPPKLFPHTSGERHLHRHALRDGSSLSNRASTWRRG